MASKVRPSTRELARHITRAVYEAADGQPRRGAWVAELTDLTLREKAIFAILAVTVLGMGLYPLPLSEIMHTSVNDLLVHVARSKLP